MNERIAEGAERLGITLTVEQVALLMQFLDYVIFWNRIAGITAHKKEDDIVDFMFLDSLAFYLTGIDLSHFKVCDFGTGGGFPGIPLKILYPEMDITFIDSSSKKCDFLKKVCENLKFISAETLCRRGEDLLHDPDFSEKYDVVLSRACAETSKLISLTFDLLSPDGRLIMWKGPLWKNELKNARSLMKSLSLNLSSSYDYSIYPYGTIKTIVVLSRTVL